MSFFFCLSSISLRQYCWKILAKSGGLGKNLKKERWPYRSWGGGGGGGEGGSNPLHTMAIRMEK